MVKEKPPKQKKGKKGETEGLEVEDTTIYLDLFKQLKGQFYKEKGGKSTLETLRESLGGSVLKEVTFIYQKLNKKSTETIIKTLKELYALLETKPTEFFYSLMTSYSIIHEKLLTTEFERDVFAYVLKIDALIIQKNRDAVKKNFRAFYPAWFLVQHDSMEDVKRAALANLIELIPDTDKHSTAFYVIHINYLSLVESWLTQPANQFKDINLFLDDDDCERVHSRLLGLAFRSLENSVKLMSDNDAFEEYCGKMLKMLKFDDKANVIVETFNRVKKNFTLRAEIAHFYLTLIDEDVEDFTAQQSPAIIKNFLSNADAKEPLFQQVLWEKKLMLAMLPGIALKYDSYDMPTLYKKIQSIIEVGGMGIGIPFFHNLNEFLLKTPLMDFKRFSGSKKFCGTLNDTLKQIEGLLKAYLSCLEQDICKFYMSHLVEAYFKLTYSILVQVVLPTRSNINKGLLYADKDLTDPLKKNIETVFDKFAELLVLMPLDLYLAKNSPEHSSELMVGINNYKFIPKHYASFLKSLVESQDNSQTVAENRDLLERVFSRFAAAVPSFQTDKRKFESFLILIDFLAKENIEPRTPEAAAIVEIIKNLFENSSNFLKQFSADNLDIDKIESSYNKDSFGNFFKYLQNILQSQSSLNKQICEQIVPAVIVRLTNTLAEALGDNFELFEDEKKRLDILQHLFAIFYMVQDWKYKNGKHDVKEINQVFSKLLQHVEEISSVDENLLLSKKGSLQTLIVAFTPNIKLQALEDLVKLKGADQKEASLTLAETNASAPSCKASRFAHYTISAQFVNVIEKLVDKFMRGRVLTNLVIYDVVSRFSQYIPEDSLMQMYARVLHKSNNKDEYVRYKLLLLEPRFKELRQVNAEEVTELIFDYVNESKSFGTDITIIKMEKFLHNIDKSGKNCMLMSLGKILTGYVMQIQHGGKGHSRIKEDNRDEFVLLFDYYLARVAADGELEQNTADSLVHMVLQPPLFVHSLESIFIWTVFKTVISRCRELCDLKIIFRDMFLGDSTTGMSVLYHILAASSCLQIVLHYDLKHFLVELCQNTLLPVLNTYRQINFPYFLDFLRGAVELAITEDIQYIYGLKRLLAEASSETVIDDNLKAQTFLAVIAGLERHKHATGDKLNRLVEITSNVLSYFKRALFSLPFVKNYKTALAHRLREYLGMKAPEASPDPIANTSVTAFEPNYSNVKVNEFLFELGIYLSICRQTRMNNISEFKQVSLDLVDSKNPAFGQVKREVILSMFFKLLNVAIEDGELENYTENIETIEAAYREGVSLSSFGEQKNLLLVSLLEFLRRVISVMEMFSKEFEQSVHSQIAKLAINKVRELNDIKKQKQDLYASYGCGFDELLVEIAETLTRFCISPQASVGEDDLYLLLNCGVPVVQKASLVVLNDFYLNKINPIEVTDDEDAQEAKFNKKEGFVPEILKVLEANSEAGGAKDGLQKLKKKTGANKASSEILEIKTVDQGSDLSTLSYLLTWIELMQRVKSQRLENSAEQRFYEYILSTHADIYESFLNRIFQWVIGLRLPSKELDKKIEKINVSELPMEWTDYINKDIILAILLHAFYKFASNFPKFLRNWVSSGDKKYTALATAIVRAKISRLIFDFETQQIDNKEPIWRSEEFSITVYKNTREIEAVYTKEDANLSMKFTLPETYPIEYFVSYQPYPDGNGEEDQHE